MTCHIHAHLVRKQTHKNIVRSAPYMHWCLPSTLYKLINVDFYLLGAFGKVYKGALSRDNSEAPIDIAIKTLKGIFRWVHQVIIVIVRYVHFVDPTLQQAEEFISESVIMLGFDHPNVLSLLGVCFDTEQNLPLIILPYMANGDLKTFLLKCRGDNEPYVLPTVSHVSCIIKISTNT